MMKAGIMDLEVNAFVMVMRAIEVMARKFVVIPRPRRVRDL